MATSQIWQRIAGRLGRPYNFRLVDSKLRGFCLEEVGKFWLFSTCREFNQTRISINDDTNIMLATKHCGIKFDPSFPCITWDTATIASKSLVSPSYSRWYPNAVSKIAWGWRPGYENSGNFIVLRSWRRKNTLCKPFPSKKVTIHSSFIHTFTIPPVLDFHLGLISIFVDHQSDILLRLVDAILQASSLMLNDSTETSSPFQPISCGKLHPKTQWFCANPKNRSIKGKSTNTCSKTLAVVDPPNIGSIITPVPQRGDYKFSKPIIFIIFRFHVKHC